MISVVALMSEGLGAEVATVGKEGMVGLPIFPGADSSPFHLMSQLEGEALRTLPGSGEGSDGRFLQGRRAAEIVAVVRVPAIDHSIRPAPVDSAPFATSPTAVSSWRA